MCGINGFTWRDEILIAKMNSTGRYRGPDDSGIYLDNKISLGHNRLSIIDLSSAGHQPMANETSSLWITYNGEIYNAGDIRNDLIKKGHLFKSRTDTEVVIHAYEEYGIDCCNKFNGMWAFCLYDKNKSVLILSRDRFGIKPLYYYYKDGRLIFSSMIAGILCHNITTAPNEKIIMQYLAFNLLHHTEETFFKQINSLCPGNNLTLNMESGNLNITQWYNPEIRKPCDKKSIRRLFSESINLRTISDVPIGSCLSGGIDSSSIVSLLDKILPDTFSTYSLIIPNHRLDESRYIKEIGKITNTKQFFTTLEEHDFINELQDFVECQEEPVTGLSVYAQYRVMKLAHENGAKVLLDGQGGDEIFAGYVYYFSYYYYELLTKCRLFDLSNEAIRYLFEFKNFYPHLFFLFNLLPERIQNVVYGKVLNKWINHNFLKLTCPNEMDPRWEKITLNEALRLTLSTTSIPHLLRWEDKNSMRWSIESRLPFLDVNLVESAMSLPSKLKLRNGKTKIIFKEAVNDLLPDMIKYRKDKIGFGVPDNEFFQRNKIASLTKDLIYSQSFKNRHYWNWTVIEKLYKGYLNNKNNIGREIMKWINLELWFQTYFQ